MGKEFRDYDSGKILTESIFGNFDHRPRPRPRPPLPPPTVDRCCDLELAAQLA